jgi:glycosyltransferase involved in cell wall biosynthesis
MKIDLIANDGSPLGVVPAKIYGDGVGGAELAMMSLMEAFAKRGHEVRVFNDPAVPGRYEKVEYFNRKKFNKRDNRDVLIIFRSPNPLMDGATAKLRKVWWSCDQFTIGNFTTLSHRVDFCVTISPYHTNYHIKNWQIEEAKIGHIDLGVRLDDYDGGIEKVKDSMIFCSVPDRGLAILHAAWPLIQKEVPSATLSITSDYRLWGVGANNAHHRLNWAGMKGVTFYGKVDRGKLVRLQMEAEIMPYPCTYEELFCISVAECQVAGALPVTTQIGALLTTNEFGKQVSGNLTNPMELQNNFVDVIVDLLTKDRDYMVERAKIMQVSARQRFDWDKIAQKWEHLFKEGELPK